MRRRICVSFAIWCGISSAAPPAGASAPGDPAPAPKVPPAAASTQGGGPASAPKAPPSDSTATEGDDQDQDGLPDAAEDLNQNGRVDPGETDPKARDSDRDNVPDDVERRLGTDPTRADDVPPIPEPLVFDLVRNLGSRRGELEVNTLVRHVHRAPRALLWAPEVEYAFADGYAVELELPFHDTTLESVKVGIQATLGQFLREKGIHGIQVLGERALLGGEVAAAALYVVGLRIGSYVSVVGLLGPSVTTSRDRPRVSAGMIANPSVFVQPRSWLTVGIETGFEWKREGFTGMWMPEVHVSPLPKVKVQGGVGVLVEGAMPSALSAFRVSVEL